VFEEIEAYEEELTAADFSSLQVHCPEIAKMAHTLMSYLTSTTEETPLYIIQRGPQHTDEAGLEALRRLSKEFAPFGEISTILLLKKYLHATPVNIGKLRSAIETSEDVYGKFKSRAKVDLPDVLRRMVIMELLPEPILSHCRLKMSEYLIYDDLKKEILKYVDLVHSQVSAGGQAPMDVSSLGESSSLEIPHHVQLWLASVDIDVDQAHVALCALSPVKGKGKGGKSSSLSRPGQQQQTKFCTNCGPGRHATDQCFTLHPHLKPVRKERKEGTGGKKSKGKGKGRGLSAVEESGEGDEEDEEDEDEEQEGHEESSLEIAALSSSSEPLSLSLLIELSSVSSIPPSLSLSSLSRVPKSFFEPNAKFQMVLFTVDSAAARSVLPEQLFSSSLFEILPAGDVKYKTANGSLINESGRQKVQFTVESGATCHITFSLTKVHKPLVSVDAIVKKGGEAHFSAKPYLTMASGQKLKMYQHYCVYVLPVWIERSSKKISHTKPLASVCRS